MYVYVCMYHIYITLYIHTHIKIYYVYAFGFSLNMNAYQCGLGYKFVEDCDFVKSVVKSVLFNVTVPWSVLSPDGC